MLMTKKEAAAFVGVGIRALERYAKAGRLSVHQRKGKTRPIVLYDEAELLPLKDEASARLRPRAAVLSPVGESTDTVGFRLDSYYRKRLLQAAEHHGMSPGEYARRLVILALEERQGEETLREISELRRDLALSVKALLCFAGKAEVEEAGQWVAENLQAERR